MQLFGMISCAVGLVLLAFCAEATPDLREQSEAFYNAARSCGERGDYPEKRACFERVEAEFTAWRGSTKVALACLPWIQTVWELRSLDGSSRTLEASRPKPPSTDVHTNCCDISRGDAGLPLVLAIGTVLISRRRRG